MAVMNRLNETQRLHQSSNDYPYFVNEFGFVSEESIGFHEEFVKKYCNDMQEGRYLVPPSSKEMLELTKKQKLASKHIHHPLQDKSTKFKSCDDIFKNYHTLRKIDENLSRDGDKPKVPRMKIHLPAQKSRDHQGDRPPKDAFNHCGNLGDTKESKIDCRDGRQEAASSKNDKMDLGALTKRPYVPAPLSFQELLKLAERKQHEPVFVKCPQFESKRLMTQKEKALYLEKIAEIKKRKEEMKKNKSTLALPTNPCSEFSRDIH